MDRKIDFKRFTVLMATLGEATPGENPSSEKIEIYFRCLQDMPFEEVEKNALNHLRFHKFFPTIAEIRGERDPELEAQEDFKLLSDVLDRFYAPEIHGSAMRIIEMKLEESGRSDLVPMLRRYGTEIYYGDNITATRAQFIKARKVEIERDRVDMIEGRGKTELPERLTKLLEPIER